jgi:hypothetical protein
MIFTIYFLHLLNEINTPLTGNSLLHTLNANYFLNIKLNPVYKIKFIFSFLFNNQLDRDPPIDILINLKFIRFIKAFI